ncbi:hypothetical protein AY599_28730 [Leptolyngbya valderiana BDU 20041]|nr:GAF domain-containing protein [Geitlerinema sp. CS-897]OAB62112.1 hypothetical protein AY599_28730 [Leptolyngbya valderiana BDU 20041]PPT10220.1 Circadian input kinase A [Geitlerinema sp. FC II]
MLDRQLRILTNRLSRSLAGDALIQSKTQQLRDRLNVDRIVLYYFYRKWKGQVTFESLSSPEFSILGSTGADDCFTGEYAQLYLEGRLNAIDDVDTAEIHPCHREFLNSIGVKANLVAPILQDGELWGLLVAHHCRSPRVWSQQDKDEMRSVARELETVAVIRNV